MSRGIPMIDKIESACNQNNLRNKDELDRYEHAGQIGIDALVCKIRAIHPELSYYIDSKPIKAAIKRHFKNTNIPQELDVQEEPIQDQGPIQEQ